MSSFFVLVTQLLNPAHGQNRRIRLDKRFTDETIDRWNFWPFWFFSIVVPIVINKTTESTHFDTWKPRLREIWMLIFVLASAYFLFKPEAKDFFMKLHAGHPGVMGYLVVALLGAISLCLYWAFTGFLTPAAQPAKHVFSVPRTDPESATFFDQIPPDQLTLRDLFAHDFTEKTSVIKFFGQLENHNVPHGMPTAIPYFLVFEQDSHPQICRALHSGHNAVAAAPGRVCAQFRTRFGHH